MIEVLFELLESGFWLVLTAATVAAPVALLALGVDMLTDGWMAARIRCWLWTVVAIRLLMPLAPSSVLSLQNALVVLDYPSNEKSTGEWFQRVSLDTFRSHPEVPSHDLPGWYRSNPAPIPTDPAARTNWNTVLIVGLSTAWLVGAVWVLVRAIVASLRFRRRLQSLPAIDEPTIIDAVQQACRDIGVAVPVLKRVPGLVAPALFGLRRPTLCLPASEPLTDVHIRMVALHEAMHIRRRDAWIAWLLVAVRAAHWCNPIAWYTLRRVEHYREQACDDAVRKHTPRDQHAHFTELLLRFASAKPANANMELIGLSFARPAQRLGARIVAFTLGDGERRMPTSFGAAMVVAVALVGLTDCTTDCADDIPDSPPPAVPISSVADARLQFKDRPDLEEASQSSPIEEKTYHLTSALENADKIPVGVDPKQWLLGYAKFGHQFEVPQIRESEDDHNTITVTMPRRQHEYFTNVLAEVERLGHTHQVMVQPRLIPSELVERELGIDWRHAVKFASPDLVDSSPWYEGPPANEEKPSVSVESTTYDFVPFVVVNLSEHDMRKIVETLQAERKYAPSPGAKYTTFSGQPATIRDQSYRPFVTSINYIPGDLATAVQPNVVVIDEGARIDYFPKLYDDDHLDLRCRLTLSTISNVREVKLPGQDTRVQTPQVRQLTVSAAARMKQGDSLLISCPGDTSYYYAITVHWLPDPVEVE